MKKRLIMALFVLVVAITIGVVSCTVSQKADAGSETKVTAEKETEKKEKTKKGKEVEEKEETSEVDEEEKGTEEKEEKEETKNEKTSDTKKTTETKKTTTEEKTTSSTVTSTKDETKKEETKKEETKKEETKKDEHTHSWTPVYKEVDNGHYEQQLVKEAWVEEKKVTKKAYREVCKTCGYVFPYPTSSKDVISHYTGLSTCNSYKTVLVDVEEVEYVNHPAEYANVWVPNVQKVVDYYKCTCGATKQ